MTASAGLDHKVSRQTPFNFPHTIWELLEIADPRIIRLAVIAAVVVWLPTAILAAAHGLFSLKWFLFDFAAQSRLLVVTPFLILTEHLLIARQAAVARQFVDAGLVKEQDVSQVEEDFAAFERRGNSIIARVVIVLMIYALAVSALLYLPTGFLAPWCYRAGTGGDLSFAGYWYVLVSLPVLLYLLLHWVWRQLLWSWFLRLLGDLDLQLIPAHPDLMAGLSFAQTYLRGHVPFALSIGIIVAGGIANRVVHLHQSVLTFKYYPLIVVAVVLVLCVGPLYTFVDPLLHARRRGIFEYGSLALGLGYQFEKKWVGPDRTLSPAILEKQDFSATIDLYSVVANVRDMKFVAVDMQYLLQPVGAALAPFVPLALFAVPFEVLLKSVVKFLL